MATNWLQRAREKGTPWVDGEQVTFYWHGTNAPRLMGDFCDWENRPVEMQRAGKQHWIYQLRLPLDAYMEYAYLEGNSRQPDPFNRRRTPNGMGKFNHYFYMPDGKPTELTIRPKRTRAAMGIISRHMVLCEGMVAGKQRTVTLYHPPVQTSVPLLVVWDGRDYLQRARLPQMVDNLIAQKRIQPIAMVMVQNGGWARWMEYYNSESTLVFLLTKVLPLAQQHLALLDLNQAPGAYGVMGASMGGLMAMYAGLRLPQIFGKVLSQSGAFMLRENWRNLAFDLAHAYGSQGQKIWMDVGSYDFPDLLKGNSAMRDLLLAKGFNVSYREYPAGHNYPAWRDDVWRGLEYLYPARMEV